MNTQVNSKHRLITFLFVIGSVFSMLISSAFTTNNAWAAAKPPASPNGITCPNPTANNLCLAGGTKQNYSNSNFSVNRGANQNSRKVPLVLNSNKNESNSSSVNHNQNNQNPHVQIIGKIPGLNTKVSTQVTTNKQKDPASNSNGAHTLLVKNQKDPTSNTNGAHTLIVNNQKDPPADTQDLHFGKNQDRDVSDITSFEEVTGHHLSS